MLSSSAPIRLPKIWAASAGAGFIRPIPTASQIGVQNGAASLTDGFPPLTLTSTPSGGVPPFGQDMNGIIQWLSSINQWFQAGGPLTFNATFATAIGGYPKGAVLQTAALTGGFWLNTADNNTNDPDGGGTTNWVNFFAPVFAGPTFSGTATFTGALVLSGTGNLGANTVAATQTPGSGNTKVANTAYADGAATTAQNTAETYAGVVAAAAQSNAQTYALSLVNALAAEFNGTPGSDPGHFHFANGFTVVWGTDSSVSAADFPVTFSYPFSAKASAVVAVCIGNPATLVGAIVDNVTAAGFDCRVRDAAGGVVNTGVNWIAYGPT